MIPFAGFDIETRPRLDRVDRFMEAFPDFNPDAVKCGHLKDPAKIAEKKAQAEADHAQAAKEHRARAYERAALNPRTAEIVVIGMITEDGAAMFLDAETEAENLNVFWRLFAVGFSDRRFVYWSGCGKPFGFDLSFLITRSRLLGVRVPSQAFSGRYPAQRLVDLAADFLLHERDSYLSLSAAADLFDLYDSRGMGPGPDAPIAGQTIFRKSKSDPVTGENFHCWWDGKASEEHTPQQQRAFARQYLTNDLLHLFHMAPRIL